MAAASSWMFIEDKETSFSIDFSGMKVPAGKIEGMKGMFEAARREMGRIEAGEIKNPDEKRKVTHFTDRAVYGESPLFREVEEFAEKIRSGAIKGGTGKKFEAVVVNGIGGSALGPQLMQFAVNGPYWNELHSDRRRGWLKIYFLDNTDSSGVADLLAAADLETLLVAHISKSGGTQETKNNMIALESAYRRAGLDFAAHSCAVTMKDSSLDKHARSNKWMQVFEMAESIGGRTSETSIVGHLPAALTGVDFKEFLRGACHMDALTRNPDFMSNPGYILPAMWHIAGDGRGDKNMVIVPYSDRLVLFSRYLQQLVMESIGKEKDLDGKTVEQGLNVFGNKGGTDAHAFIQQLNDGRDDFFVTFIEVWRDRMDLPIENGVSMGDYLHGFQAGLAAALKSKGRQVIEMRVRDSDEFNLGMLIALYERAVAVYAEFVHINAFHQPGVQAYKLASKTVIDTILELNKRLAGMEGFEGTMEELLGKTGMRDSAAAPGILEKFAENSGSRGGNSFALSRRNDGGRWVYSVGKF